MTEYLLAVATVQQVDPVKWSDAVSTCASVVQAFFIAGGIIVAVLQIWQVEKAQRVKMFDDISEKLEEPSFAEAALRLTTRIDPSEDVARIHELLARDEHDPEHLQCEKDITVVTNLYSRIWSNYKRNLLDRELFLDEYDEFTLFLCHALRGGHELYDQADYAPLMALARRCRDNYVLVNGPNGLLAAIPIPGLPPRRFNRERMARQSGRCALS
jgi:hypothetical protein